MKQFAPNQGACQGGRSCDTRNVQVCPLVYTEWKLKFMQLCVFMF